MSPAEDPLEIDVVPWSELGPEWISLWGGAPQPEHVEITGQTGSGKTYFLAAILQERAARFDDREILVATKPADETLSHLGWPVASSFKDVRRYRQVVFWPRTRETGEKRERHQEKAIGELLERLWVPGSNCVVAFDEIGYVERLSRSMKKQIAMYWREARSQGITLVAMKQRPVWILRDAHSETRWKIVFPPADRGDMPRFAQLLGKPKEWEPVLDSLSEHQFVLHHSARRDDIDVQSFVSFIDEPVRPIPSQVRQRQEMESPVAWRRR